MAVTKIWKITNNLGKVINYSENGKKTRRSSLDATQIYTHVSNKKLKKLMLNFNILDRKERVR